MIYLVFTPLFLVCSVLSLSAETTVVPSSLFQSAVTRIEFQTKYGTEIVTQDVVNHANQKGTPPPPGGGTPPPIPASGTEVNKHRIVYQAQVNTTVQAATITQPTTVINAEVAAGGFAVKAGNIRLYNTQGDSLKILRDLTPKGSADKVAVVNCANANVRGGGGQEGAVCEATSLYEGFKNTTDKLMSDQAQNLQGNLASANLKILRSSGVHWVGDPDFATAQPFLSDGMIDYHKQTGWPLTVNTDRPAFDVYSVAAVNTSGRGALNAVQQNLMKDIMKKLFDMLFTNAARAGIDELVLPVPGTSIFLGNAQAGQIIVEALSDSLKTHRMFFNAIHIPNFSNNTYLPNAINDLDAALKGGTTPIAAVSITHVP